MRKPQKSIRTLSVYPTLATAAMMCFFAAGLSGKDEKPKTPAKPAAAPKAPAAGRGATPAAGRGAAAPAAGRGPAAAGAGRGTAPGAAGRGGPAAARPGERSAGLRPTGAPAPRGERITHTAGGGEIHRDGRGQVREIHAHGMEIHHGPGGSRTIIRERPGHVVVVSNRYGHGYIEHPYRFGGREFVHRTYYVGGVAYVRMYQPFVYGGIALNVYAPPVYYAPAFYGWAYNPWVAPIVYPWGWAGNPWYAYWGAYFTPYPTYATPALWLTDYYVAQTLQAAYQEQAAALANAQAAAAPAPLTPDVKQAIADEVRRQISLENAEAAAGAQAAPDPGSSGIARILADPMPHVFVVSNPLDLTSNNGECPVTEGDVLQLNPGTPPNSTAANMFVLASKGQDCVKGSAVTVGVADLQDMQNHMRETIDQGLGELQKKQGQNGIPKAPAAAAAAPTQTGYAAIAPPADPNVAMELSQQTKEADSAEREVLSQEGSAGSNPEPVAAAPAAPAPPPESVDIAGWTEAQVIAQYGQPASQIVVGTKKIMTFKNAGAPSKVTLTNGKVTNIE
jgi:hypothetical protein